MITRPLLILIFFLVIYFPGKACTCYCDYTETVCSILNAYEEEVVVLGVVNSFENDPYYNWEINVLEVLRGQFVPDTLDLWFAHTCSEILFNSAGQEAVIGDTVIFVGESIGIDTGMFAHGYFMYSCAWAPLYYKNGEVHGPITASTETMSLVDFREFVDWEYRIDADCQTCYCECYLDNFLGIPDTTFCLTKKLAFHRTKDLIIARVQVESYYLHGLSVTIKNLIRGFEVKTDLSVWGNYGTDCRAPNRRFEPGKEYVMILYRLAANDLRASEESTGDYEIANCGQHYIEVKDNMVIGPITGSIDSMPYTTFHNQVLNDFKDIRNCDDWIVATHDQDDQPELSLFPNPTRDRLTITSTEQPLTDVEIYTTDGKRVGLFAGQGTNILELDLKGLNLGGQVLILHIQGVSKQSVKRLVCH